mgnify:CR=1 FL=1
MRGYRSLQRDEAVQMGDERMNGNCGWVPAEAVWIGQPVPEDLTVCFRRPVDAVSREEHERLQRAVEACSRYFEHCDRVSVSQQRSDSGQMGVRMALRNEAREAVEKLKEVT